MVLWQTILLWVATGYWGFSMSAVRLAVADAWRAGHRVWAVWMLVAAPFYFSWFLLDLIRGRA